MASVAVTVQPRQTANVQVTVNGKASVTEFQTDQKVVQVTAKNNKVTTEIKPDRDIVYLVQIIQEAIDAGMIDGGTF